MSWITKIKNDLIIVTGDGKQYRPLWQPASFKSEYNISQFNFPDVEGTLVKRGTVMGREFSFGIIFQGENHLDEGLEFWESTKDRNPWTLQHPFYGSISVHPSSLNFDNSDLNLTRVTGTIIETILEDRPRAVVSEADEIKRKVPEFENEFAQYLDEDPTQADINTAVASNKKMYKLGVPIIQIPDEFQAYTNLFNTAQAAAVNALSTPIVFMRSITTLINYPSLMTLSVKARFNQLLKQWDVLTSTVEGLFYPSSKKIFQIQGAMNIAAMCYTSVTPLTGNYTNQKEVLNIIKKLTTVYNSYLEKLDEIQTANGGSPLSFIPSYALMFELQTLVMQTISSLFEIALTAKTERRIFADTDTNVIILTKKLYGLDPDDNNINELIANNGWGMNKLLQIKKGTEVVYYV
jgi:hypothetical protein